MPLLTHAYSQTIADGTATSVVRPSDWNSAHAQIYTLTGNTLSQLNSTVSGTNVVYAGSGDIYLGGTNGSLIFSQQPTMLSYWENFPMLAAGVSLINYATQNTVTYFQPAPVRENLSLNFFRIPHNFATQSTSFASSINTTFSCSLFSSFKIELWRQLNGASSRSLSKISSSFAGWTQVWSIQANSTGSQWSLSFSMTYPAALGSTSSHSTSLAVSQTRFELFGSIFTLWTGNRFIDIPFNSSIPAGNYWMGVAHSSAASTQAASAATGGRWPHSVFAGSLINSQFRPMNSLGASGSDHLRPGHGSFVSAATVNVIHQSQISTIASHPFPYIQGHRTA